MKLPISTLTFLIFLLSIINLQAQRKEYRKLNKEAQKELKEAFLPICTCMEEQEDAMDAALAKLKEIKQKMEGMGDSLNFETFMPLLVEFSQAMPSPDNCEGVQPIEPNSTPTLKREIEKIYGDLSQQEREEKSWQIIKFVMRKKCPKFAELLYEATHLTDALRQD